MGIEILNRVIWKDHYFKRNGDNWAKTKGWGRMTWLYLKKSFLGRRNKCRSEARTYMMCSGNGQEASSCSWIPVQGAEGQETGPERLMGRHCSISGKRRWIQLRCCFLVKFFHRGPFWALQEDRISSYSFCYTTCSLACILCLFSQGRDQFILFT